jgi:predicted  nucleic acid-binding Zn-ribbon protein
MKMTKKIDNLHKERLKIEKEIENLQKTCKHPTKSLKNVRERLDSTTMVIRWTCNTCSSVVGIPNNNELQEYLKQ